MGRATLIELGHLFLGLAAAAALTYAVAWSYPLGRRVIWGCGAGAMVATVAMGVGPLRRAADADRGRR